MLSFSNFCQERETAEQLEKLHKFAKQPTKPRIHPLDSAEHVAKRLPHLAAISDDKDRSQQLIEWGVLEALVKITRQNHAKYSEGMKEVS